MRLGKVQQGLLDSRPLLFAHIKANLKEILEIYVHSPGGSCLLWKVGFY